MKVYRIVAAIVLGVLACVILLCSCHTEGSDTAAEYGKPVEFEGDPHEASVLFVNVGKADCAIVTVDGHTWLVDTGTKESFPAVFGALGVLGAESVDGVIVSHEHGDHAGGLDALAKRYGGFRVVTPELLTDSALIDEAVNENGLSCIRVRAGAEVEIVPGVSFKVLGPAERLPGDGNDNSLVALLEVNGRRFLFTGDVEAPGDAKLLESGADVKCDVLKVPNHGNPDACSEAFAKAASPLISVVSTDRRIDRNSANPRVLARLSSSEIRITQEYGVGVLVSVSPRGELSVSFPERPEPGSGAVIEAASKAEQSFVLKNTSGERVDLTGWFLYSTKGFEVFDFPEGTILEAGGTLTVACRKSPAAGTADLVWNEKKAWAGSKLDEAVLCDPYGNEIARKASE